MAIRPLSDVPVYNRFLIVGASGTGKTVCVSRSAADLDLSYADVAMGRAQVTPDPTLFYVCVREPQGLTNARMWNPALQGAFVETAAQAGELLAEIKTGMLARLGCTRLAFDGVTQLQRLLKDDITDALLKENPTMRANWFDRDDWTFLGERSRRLFNLINSLPIDVAMTAHEVEDPDATTAAQRLLPKLEGTASKLEIGGYCSAVGRADKMMHRDQDLVESVRHGVLFTSPFLVKGLGTIQGWQKPCWAAWIDVLAGRLPPTATMLAQAPTMDALPALSVARAAVDAPAAPAATASVARRA